MSSLPRVLIAHGWSASVEHPPKWMPWLRNELESRGFRVIFPSLPNSFAPSADEWVRTIKESIGVPDANTHFVGHSMGGVAIYRYLERGRSDVGSVVTIASPIEDMWRGWFKSFYTKPFDWEKIRSRTNDITLVHSKDDETVPVAHSIEVASRLRARLRVEEGNGHYGRWDFHVTENTTVLDSILRAHPKMMRLASRS